MTDLIIKIRNWSRAAMLLCAIVFGICTLVAYVTPPHHMGLYDTATYQARVVLFALPVVGAIYTLTSGWAHYKGRSGRKRAVTSTTPLERIMQQLSESEQEYLQHQLDERYAGIGADGELLSVDDLIIKKNRDAG